MYFAGWKQHYSLYPAGPHLVAAFKDELVACKIDKGTIRFSLTAPVPTRLIGDIARFRAGELAERTRMRPHARSCANDATG
ncbi:MAG TPA: hypothetical protein VI386_36045, partial [Candidatus Sulfotelmatobacter sp.]